MKKETTITIDNENLVAAVNAYLLSEGEITEAQKVSTQKSIVSIVFIIEDV